FFSVHSFPTRRSSDLESADFFGYIGFMYLFGFMSVQIVHEVINRIALKLYHKGEIAKYHEPIGKRVFMIVCISIANILFILAIVDRKSTRLNSSHGST